jgi:hypothetical protein
LGGDAGDPGVPTINAKNVDGGPPWEAVPKIQERPPSTLRNVDGGLPWEAMLETRERPPSMLETSTMSPLGGDDRDPGAPTINARNIMAAQIPKGIKPITSWLLRQSQQIESVYRHRSLTLRVAERSTWWRTVRNSQIRRTKKSIGRLT